MNENKILAEMKKYKANELELYKAEAGWQDWMEEHTDAADGEAITEAESKQIEVIQDKLWDEAHEQVIE